MTAVDLMSRIGQIQATLSQLASVRAGGAAALSARPTAGATTTAAAAATTTAAAAATTTAAAGGTSSTAFADALAAAQGTADSSGTGAGSSAISGAISSALKSGSAALTSGVSRSASSAGIGSPAAVTADNPKGATGADVTVAAKKYLGVPYVWGGTDPAVGFDCSGFVQHVFKDLGVSVPRLVRDQMNAGSTVPNLAQAKPGDLLVMNGVEHIGIYLGNNQYIHAPIPGQKVSIAAIPTGFQFDRIVRVVPSAAPDASAGTTAAAAAGTAAGSDPNGLLAQASAARATLLAGSGK
ncbi:C40 family peptidase [Paenarthrobacter sp. Z7-10]|uniref:C40 family peptidase n=1 Tax=Paenarthrobacter sp. Z7-10 TaxID=2787635 RepID=UPI0022A92FD6|nr:C40 family peptidase [Paenarthrobacter sp. Z7-10]MCZ2403315.1 C40 family peptidase [Paenarthrobacter sp. Z7-10]